MVVKQPLAADLRFELYWIKRGVSGMMSLLVTRIEPCVWIFAPSYLWGRSSPRNTVGICRGVVAQLETENPD